MSNEKNHTLRTIIITVIITSVLWIGCGLWADRLNPGLDRSTIEQLRSTNDSLTEKNKQLTDSVNGGIKRQSELEADLAAREDREARAKEIVGGLSNSVNSSIDSIQAIKQLIQGLKAQIMVLENL